MRQVLRPINEIILLQWWEPKQSLWELFRLFREVTISNHLIISKWIMMIDVVWARESAVCRSTAPLYWLANHRSFTCVLVVGWPLESTQLTMISELVLTDLGIILIISEMSALVSGCQTKQLLFGFVLECRELLWDSSCWIEHSRRLNVFIEFSWISPLVGARSHT